MFNRRDRYIYIVLLGAYSYVNTLFSEVYQYYGITANWYYAMIVMIVITALVWEGNRLLQPLLKKIFTQLSSFKFLLVSFAAGVVLSAVVSYFLAMSVAAFIDLPANQSAISAKLALTYGTRINLFLHIINGIAVFVQQYKQKELEAEELKRTSAQAQLQAIKNQVNPHFLFNNLNVLSAMVIKENQEANKFIEEFAKVYRHLLNSQDKELVPLQEELDFIKPYIFLLEKRFAEGVQVSIEVPETYYPYNLVPASLQMLIENAIKHNIVSRSKPLQIKIAVNGHHTLVVKNNLQPKPPMEESTQVGLKNIAQRYQLITGQTITINKETDSFTVTIPLITPVA